MPNTIYDEETNLYEILKQLEIPKAILHFIKKNQWNHPTFIQSALFSLFGKRQNFMIESGSVTGKTVGALLFALAYMIKNKNGNKILIIVPHKNFRKNVYNAIVDLLKGSMIKFGALSTDSNYTESRNVYVTIDTFENYVNFFREGVLDPQDISSIIVDETEYSGTFSNIHKLVELIQYFKANIELKDKSLFVLTADGENQCVEPVKNSFGEKFTTLKDIAEEEENSEEEGNSEEGDEEDSEEGSENIEEEK